jgi:AraC family transcriptional regulator
MSEHNFFRLYLWPHRLLLLGPAFETDCHRHHAAQIAICLTQAPMRIRANEEAAWQEGRAFYIPPDASHQLESTDSSVGLLYLDPEGAECLSANGYFGHSKIQAIEFSEPSISLSTLLTQTENDIELADKLCRHLLGGSAPFPPQLDIRLSRALQWLDRNLNDNISLAELARAASASESWLTHHFRAAIGVPIRRYVLWRRLRMAIEIALAGSTLTDAAHQAGFADAAHLSRTFRENFGVSPSFLFSARDRLRVVSA